MKSFCRGSRRYTGRFSRKEPPWLQEALGVYLYSDISYNPSLYLILNEVKVTMIRLRFAPSPTGFVHVGNARTALFNFLHAQRREGKMVLRIEDTDVERSKKEYEENLINDLKWLGLQWDEGPDTGGDFGPYRQSERIKTYQKYAQQLIDSGHAYYCFCSPEELQKEKETAVDKDSAAGYSGKCRQLDIEESKKRVQAGQEAAVRFKIPKGTSIVFFDLVRDKVTFDTNLLSDPVILRSTGIPAYNFSVVIDDHLMEITLVIRGEDHISNTARQLLIYDALGFEKPKFARTTPSCPNATGPRLFYNSGNKATCRKHCLTTWLYWDGLPEVTPRKY
jgi:nondiscriminating glutamyl-tRNA synthetase